jgi:hypothetical protein
MEAWPSGLRRWFKAPVLTGASSNLAAFKFFYKELNLNINLEKFEFSLIMSS